MCKRVSSLFEFVMRILRFIKALYRYIIFGKRVDIDDYIDRLNVCKTCFNLNKEKWKCEKCGCYVDKKAKMNTETCPEKYW